MQNIREIISENLVSLRKKFGYTQIELAKLVNYSDKAVSRWENGEVMPDYEILEQLGEIYGVDITFFLKKHEEDLEEEKEIKVDKTNKIAMAGLVVTTIWMIATVLFVFLLMYKEMHYWLVFIYSIPLTFGVLHHYNKRFFKIKFGGLVCKSGIVWSAIASLYLFLIDKYTPDFFMKQGNYFWLLFIIGVPVQIVVMLESVIRKTY